MLDFFGGWVGEIMVRCGGEVRLGRLLMETVYSTVFFFFWFLVWMGRSVTGFRVLILQQEAGNILVVWAFLAACRVRVQCHVCSIRIDSQIAGRGQGGPLKERRPGQRELNPKQQD